MRKQEIDMAVTQIHFEGFIARRYYTIGTYHVRTSVFNPYKGYCIYDDIDSKSYKTELKSSCNCSTNCIKSKSRR